MANAIRLGPTLISKILRPGRDPSDAVRQNSDDHSRPLWAGRAAQIADTRGIAAPRLSDRRLIGVLLNLIMNPTPQIIHSPRRGGRLAVIYEKA